MVHKNLFIKVTLFIHSSITGRRWGFDEKQLLDQNWLHTSKLRVQISLDKADVWVEDDRRVLD